MLKIMTIFGTRPEAIKLAPVIRELEKHNNIANIIVVTTQHREMLDQVLDTFEICPTYDLDLMKHNQSLSDLTIGVIKGIQSLLVKEKPDLMLVQGDTTTTFASSLAGFYHRVTIAHIEAGLRTNDKYSPFPEEVNRRITSVLADFHFAPTQRSSDNLLREGIEQSRIFVTGNTVIDALFMTVSKLKNSSTDKFTSLFQDIDFDKRIILVTAHRRESFGQGFRNICHALKEIAKLGARASLSANNSDIEIVYPVHLNPNVQKPVNEIIGNIDNIFLMQPLDYESFVYLMNKSYLILTDSGGIQEEAPSLGKPVLVMRDATERSEAIEAGTVKLVGTSKELIVKEAQRLLDDRDEYNKMSRAHNPYGDGKAAQRIVGMIKDI